jgi:hypothetical protein
MDAVEITVKYSCELCGTKRRNLKVMAREPEEDVRTWMDKTVIAVWHDHWRRSPDCTAQALTELMIPVPKDGPIGGATVN